MFYAIFVKEKDFNGYKAGSLYAVDPTEPTKLPPELDYIAVDGEYDEGGFVGVNEWQPDTQTFIEKPLPVIQTKQERIDEIVLGLGLSKEQEDTLIAKLEEKL